MKTKHEHEVDAGIFAVQLLAAVTTTFHDAYVDAYAHMLNVEQQLIDYDIEAANNDTDAHLAALMRATIRAAVRCADARVPFPFAVSSTLAQLDPQISEIIRRHTIQ